MADTDRPDYIGLNPFPFLTSELSFSSAPFSTSYTKGTRVRVVDYKDNHPNPIYQVRGRTGTVITEEGDYDGPNIRVKFDKGQPGMKADYYDYSALLTRQEIRPSSTLAPKSLPVVTKPAFNPQPGDFVVPVSDTLYSFGPRFTGISGLVKSNHDGLLTVEFSEFEGCHVNVHPWAFRLDEVRAPVPGDLFSISSNNRYIDLDHTKPAKFVGMGEARFEGEETVYRLIPVYYDGQTYEELGFYSSELVPGLLREPKISAEETAETATMEAFTSQSKPVKEEGLIEVKPEPVVPPRKFVHKRPMTTLTYKVLRHLQDKGSISPLEAQMSHGTIRLAHQVFILRQHGYMIRTELREDYAGHPYGRYFYDGYKAPVR